MNRIFALAGLLGGLLWIILTIAFSSDWSAPGTLQYIAYQNYNRLWSLILFLMLLGFIGLYLQYPFRAGRLGQIGFGLLVLGFVLMMAGNIAEFWVFTDSPYEGGLNPRNLSWFTFLFGWLFTLIGSLLWGIHSNRTYVLPQWVGALLILSLPISIVLLFAQSVLLPTAVVIIVLSILALRAKLVTPRPMSHHDAVREFDPQGRINDSQTLSRPLRLPVGRLHSDAASSSHAHTLHRRPPPADH